MKYSQKQRLALQTVEYFIPDHADWKHPTTRVTSFGAVGCTDREEDPQGVSAEDAFFQKSERGTLPKKVKNLPRLVALLWGQRYMAIHASMWREDFTQGLLHPADFDDEPPHIQKLARSCCEDVERKWET